MKKIYSGHVQFCTGNSSLFFCLLLVLGQSPAPRLTYLTCLLWRYGIRYTMAAWGDLVFVAPASNFGFFKQNYASLYYKIPPPFSCPAALIQTMAPPLWFFWALNTQFPVHILIWFPFPLSNYYVNNTDLSLLRKISVKLFCQVGSRWADVDHTSEA